MIRAELSVCVRVCLCRNLLCSVVRVKLSCYEMENQCSLSVEDYLKAFLENEVKPLWPKGWMQTRSVCGPSLPRPKKSPQKLVFCVPLRVKTHVEIRLN